MSNIIVGVDPGLSGAIAVLKGGVLIEVVDMPTMAKGVGTKQQVNAAQVARFLEASGSATVYLEYVWSGSKQGVASMFSFGESVGVMRGVIATLGMPVELVTPQVWKRRFGLIKKDKDMARTKAVELYPSASLWRKKDIGRADAILIARYGWEMEQKRVAA